MNEDQETMPLPEQADIAEEFVRGLAERFGTTVDFQRENVGSDEIRITVSGDELGRMVGHRGMTAVRSTILFGLFCSAGPEVRAMVVFE